MAIFSKKQKQSPPRRRQVNGQPEVRPDNPFRRGRTLTGSTSSLASAAEPAAQLKSPRARAHELATKRRRIGGLLLLAVFASALLYGVISQFTATVVVRATGNISLASQEPYQAAIQEYLAKHPAERLRFLLNTEALAEFVQVKTPEVAQVQLAGSAGFGASAFRLNMREPIVGWSIGGQQQFVDTTGTAFAKNYFNKPRVEIVDESGIPLESGQAVTSNRFLGFVGLAVGLAETHGYKVNQVVLPREKTREVELRLEGVSYPVKLSVDRPAGEQIEDMVRAMKWLSDNGKNPQYLDVRVSGRAFYREG